MRVRQRIGLWMLSDTSKRLSREHYQGYQGYQGYHHKSEYHVSNIHKRCQIHPEVIRVIRAIGHKCIYIYVYVYIYTKRLCDYFGVEIDSFHDPHPCAYRASSGLS